ncbi:uncharacterized protein BO97DRAFT_354259 [Aspergillus homomorphus CBS 101889]|uniref:F-box domain protein n=1 Tax=Aspergillus homomorphus (strain CBS 101889) TaxID=1450537 RepID=A0A395HKJ4_ASPHC|nr:hypothetical protein BO97DRAFT_354259 [Aspergillus homomorphus CBS 101889]RAL08347.1 hypothetical protein BO97DRAFT_354259 [Aspergillus homomorphus CBS 101889]
MSLNIHDLHGLDGLKSDNASWSDIEEDDDDDDDDISISPISDKAPAWSGTRWARFFPELASHFSLTSPTSNTAQLPSIARSSHTRPLDSPTSLKSSESVERKDRLPSVLSDGATDKRSSGYTLTSSITSQSSRISSPRCNSPYSVHSTSPDLPGFFDDGRTLKKSPSRTLSRHSSVKESRDKDLPKETSFRLPPLLVRHKSHQLPKNRETGHGNYRSLKSPSLPDIQENYHRPTLSQTAAGVEPTSVGFAESQQTQRISPHSHLQYSAGPLQIRRGNMDMIATRPAPMPPMSIHDVQQAIRAQSCEEMNQTKGEHKNKGPFSFGLPGLHHWSTPPTLRTSSTFPTASALKSTSLSSRLTGDENKGEVAELPGSTIDLSKTTSTSINSERELRSTLPSLQTKDLDNPGFINSAPPSSTAKEASENTNHGLRYNKLDDDSLVGSSEKYFVSHSKYGDVDTNTSHRREVSQASTIYELDASPAVSQIKQRADTPCTSQELSAEMHAIWSKDIILAILRQVESLDDLFNVSLVCRDFYSTFKDHELDLIKNAVFAMSPPAWELREMSPPWGTEWQFLLDPDAPVPEYTPALYLQQYAQDICTLAQLKSIILARCSTFLRPETIRGLSGLDDACATEVDDAFWRVWTFCRIFGCGKHREGDIAGQMDWLKGGTMATDRRVSVAQSITDPYDMGSVLFEPPAGFGHGNAGGLTQAQLHSMTEIWTCLGVLLQPMHGKTRLAREVGVFDGHNVREKATAKEGAVLEEWTHYILTLGLSAVLNLGSITTEDAAVVTTFKKAQSMGLARWAPSDTVASRSSFLREAVSKAYRPRENTLSEASCRSSGASKSPSPSAGRDRSPTSGSPGKTDSLLEMQRRRQAAYSAQLKLQKQQPTSMPTSSQPAEERPISNYETIISRLEGRSSGPVRTESIASPPRASSTIPGLYQQSTAPALQHPQVCDPTDKAMDMMVRELGFEEEDAKWALKITDSGEGINASAAVSLLMREHRNQRESRGGASSPSGSLLSSVINSPESRTSGWKWAH